MPPPGWHTERANRTLPSSELKIDRYDLRDVSFIRFPVSYR